MALVILYSGWLTPALCIQNPDKKFVFGDNLQRFGKGGQAIIRDCNNAVGVATKRKPAMSVGSFFSEHDEDDMDAVLSDLRLIWTQLQLGATVVIPVTADGEVSLGLERAELRQRAPDIYEAISMHVKEMVDNYGSPDIVDTI